jgi:hypothetical protein
MTCGCPVPVTAARVDFVAPDNATWQDIIQFDALPDGTEWVLDDNFIMEIKASSDDAAPLFTLSTDNGRIVVVSAVQRLIKFSVDDAVLAAALKPETYQYDLVMYDNSPTPVRVVLLYGEVTVTHGVTQD